MTEKRGTDIADAVMKGLAGKVDNLADLTMADYIKFNKAIASVGLEATELNTLMASLDNKLTVSLSESSTSSSGSSRSKPIQYLLTPWLLSLLILLQT